MSALQPGSVLTAESVSLLKAGDVLRDAPYDPFQFSHIADGIAYGLDGWNAMREDLLLRFTFIGRPDQDGWIEWSGGENPVPGCVVEVKLRSGDCFTGSDLTDDGTWRHIWGEADIIAFRLAAPSVPGEGFGSSAGADTHRATDGSEVGWLIEDQNEPQWLTLKPAEAMWSMVFTKDSIEALRFPRRIDAEDYIRTHLDDAPVCITEHSWPALPTTAAEPALGGDEPKANAPSDVAGARERLEGPGLPSNMNLGSVTVRRRDLRTILSHSDRQGEEIERLRGALESIANDDKPELGNRNTNDLLARMYWEIAHKAARARQGGPDHG